MRTLPGYRRVARTPSHSRAAGRTCSETRSAPIQNTTGARAAEQRRPSASEVCCRSTVLQFCTKIIITHQDDKDNISKYSAIF